MAGRWGDDWGDWDESWAESVPSPILDREIKQASDYVKFGLADLEGMHPMWIDLLLRSLLAVDQRYPDALVGERRVLSVASIGGRGRRTIGAYRDFFKKAEVPPFFAFSNRYFQEDSDPSVFQTQIDADMQSGWFVEAKGGALYVFVHELLHRPFRRLVRDSDFCRELDDEMKSLLGVENISDGGWTWSGPPSQRSAVVRQGGRYSSRSLDEFLAEYGAAGVLQGDAASAPAQAVRKLLDKYLRFDREYADTSKFVPLDLTGRAGNEAVLTFSSLDSDLSPLRERLELADDVSLRQCLIALEDSSDIDFEVLSRRPERPITERHKTAVTYKPQSATFAESMESTRYAIRMDSASDYALSYMVYLPKTDPLWKTRLLDVAVGFDATYHLNKVTGILDSPTWVRSAASIETKLTPAMQVPAVGEFNCVYVNDYFFGNGADRRRVESELSRFVAKSQTAPTDLSHVFLMARAMLMARFDPFWRDLCNRREPILRQLYAGDDVQIEASWANRYAERRARRSDVIELDDDHHLGFELLLQGILLGDKALDVAQEMRQLYQWANNYNWDKRVSPRSLEFQPISLAGRFTDGFVPLLVPESDPTIFNVPFDNKLWGYRVDFSDSLVHRFPELESPQRMGPPPPSIVQGLNDFDYRQVAVHPERPVKIDLGRFNLDLGM